MLLNAVAERTSRTNSTKNTRTARNQRGHFRLAPTEEREEGKQHHDVRGRHDVPERGFVCRIANVQHRVDERPREEEEQRRAKAREPLGKRDGASIRRLSGHGYSGARFCASERSFVRFGGLHTERDEYIEESEPARD